MLGQLRPVLQNYQLIFSSVSLQPTIVVTWIDISHIFWTHRQMFEKLATMLTDREDLEISSCKCLIFIIEIFVFSSACLYS